MDQIRIVFLGTGAAAPTQHRNVSSVAVVLDGRVLLFDCGEGTQHQLARSVVRSGALDAVFITHLHGDHLYGLPGLIATLGLNARTALLTVYGPQGIRRYLESIPHLGATYPIEVVEIPPARQMTRLPRPTIEALLPRASGGEGGRRPDEGAPQKAIKGAGHPKPAYEIRAALLDHSVPCFGYAVVEHDRPGAFDVEKARALGVPEGPLFGRLQRGDDVEAGGRIIRSIDVVGPKRPGRKIVFCTDTRPCDAAVELARDADVFIHEATYANDHAQEAADRFHSTAAEAAQVAAAAQPRLLILTHVSARYETAAPLLDDAMPIFPDTEVASDLLIVPVLPR